MFTRRIAAYNGKRPTRKILWSEAPVGLTARKEMTRCTTANKIYFTWFSVRLVLGAQWRWSVNKRLPCCLIDSCIRLKKKWLSKLGWALNLNITRTSIFLFKAQTRDTSKANTTHTHNPKSFSFLDRIIWDWSLLLLSSLRLLLDCSVAVHGFY